LPDGLNGSVSICDHLLKVTALCAENRKIGKHTTPAARRKIPVKSVRQGGLRKIEPLKLDIACAPFLREPGTVETEPPAILDLPVKVTDLLGLVKRSLAGVQFTKSSKCLRLHNGDPMPGRKMRISSPSEDGR
jgi:hypothetical protein